MAQKKISLKQLQKAVAKERKNLKTTRRTIRRRATSQQDTGFFGGLPQIGI